MKKFTKMSLAFTLLTALMSAPSLAGFYVLEDGKHEAVEYETFMLNNSNPSSYTVYEWTGPIETFDVATATVIEQPETLKGVQATEKHYIFINK